MPLTTFHRRAEGTSWKGDTFSNLDLRSMKAFGSTFVGCVFSRCNLDLADMRGCKFEKCSFWDCSMRLVNLATGTFEDCGFLRCDMEGSSLLGSLLRKVEFQDCRMAFSETLFQDCTVKDRLLISGCNLRESSLAFREVEAGSLRVEKSSLWGARIPFGCAFFTGSIDDTLKEQFLSLVAIMSRDRRVVELAGDQYPVVCRAMFGRKKWADPDSTTSPETGSKLLPNYPVPMDSTVNVTTPTTESPMMTTDGCSPGMRDGV